MNADRSLPTATHRRSSGGWPRPAAGAIASLTILLAAPSLSSAPSHQAPPPVASATSQDAGGQAYQSASLWQTELTEGRSDVIFFPDDPLTIDADRRSIPLPVELDISDVVQVLVNNARKPPTWDSPQGRYAMNVNTLDEVPDSSWFTNRNGLLRERAASLAEGGENSGPPRGDVWRIVDTVGEGKSEKFMIEDASGRRFIVKLDNPDFPELMSGAEVISTNFFYSFGYNVPQNYLVNFAPEQLVVEDEDVYPAIDLAARLEETPRTRDGRIRALASLLLEGEPIGPFLYSETRTDDPNDIFPHEHRRELRGLKVFAAWLNHTDVKTTNSLDTYVGEDGEGHIRHHLIDFGSTLGSGVSEPKERVLGWEYYVEPRQIGRGMIGFGLWERPYVRIDYPDHTAVGNIEVDMYQPWLWKPPVPNPAFRMMDAADAFWGAKIVARYTDEDVRAFVQEGRFSDPRDEERLVEVLIGRRDKTVAYWLTRTNPLDEFRVEGVGSGAGGELRFENLAVSHGLATVPLTYRYRWYRFDNHGGTRTAVATDADIEGRDAEAAIRLPDDPWGPVDEFGQRYAVVEIRTVHAGFPHWDRPVLVALRDNNGTVEVVGIRRPRELPPPPAS